MGCSRDVRFVSFGVKLPSASAPSPFPAPAPALLSAALPFAHIGRAIDAAARRLGACLPRVPVARADTAPPPPRRHGKDGGGAEERVLISEVAVRGKDGEPLERPELEAEAAAALRACRPNAALTVREVQEDVHRIVESGLFRSCMPVAVDTRDGIRLVFEVLLSSCRPHIISLYLELMNECTISVLPFVSGGAEPRLPWAGMRGCQLATVQVPGRCILCSPW
jgi:outer membrane protein insertion porin family